MGVYGVVYGVYRGIWYCIGVYRGIWCCMGYIGFLVMYRGIWGYMVLYRGIWGHSNNNNNLVLILRAFHEMIKRALHDFYL